MAPQTTIPVLAGMIPVWGVAARQFKSKVGEKNLPVLSLGAAFSFTIMGNKVNRVYDIGVAGIHRLLSHTEDIMVMKKRDDKYKKVTIKSDSQKAAITEFLWENDFGRTADFAELLKVGPTRVKKLVHGNRKRRQVLNVFPLYAGGQ